MSENKTGYGAAFKVFEDAQKKRKKKKKR